MSTEHPPCNTDEAEDVSCFECFDTGRIQAGGFELPCLVCPAGDLYMHHERNLRLAESVASQDHADLSPEFEDELEAYERNRD